MSSITVHLPDELRKSVEDLASKQQVSVDQFISETLSEKVTTSHQAERLRQRAARGSREAYLKLLDKVPDVEPDENDRME
jgi:hypothetical protein